MRPWMPTALAGLFEKAQFRDRIHIYLRYRDDPLILTPAAPVTVCRKRKAVIGGHYYAFEAADAMLD